MGCEHSGTQPLGCHDVHKNMHPCFYNPIGAKRKAFFFFKISQCRFFIFVQVYPNVACVVAISLGFLNESLQILCGLNLQILLDYHL